MLTQYLLNNARRICKSDYMPTKNDIEMIKKYYPENVTMKTNSSAAKRFTFYDCGLNPSKYSHFNKKRCEILFIVDLTAYHRTIINPNTNNEINEMQYTLNNFEKICKLKYVAIDFTNVLFHGIKN